LYIVSVLKSAPSLVELVIQVNMNNTYASYFVSYCCILTLELLHLQIDDVDTSQVSDHLDELECSSCCPKLETVNISIREISGSSQHAMSLTQFILANSTSLKTLTFNVGLCSVNLHAPILLRISQDLLRMKRASQRVRVKFLYSGYLVH
jgi:Ran GTPase-activating protein (RanGAP) involved in mRNA processing and transport